MFPRPLKRSTALILITIVAGLAVRRLPLHLPPVVPKYAGSMLWALMIYWIVSTILPKYPLLTVAALSAAVATAVELLKLYHTPTFDGFRLSLAGSLLLGRIFSVYDLVAYYLAIVVGALIDKHLRPAPAPARGT